MNLRMLQIGVLVIICYLSFTNGQCTTVNSTTSPSTSICASLHIYNDQTYSQRVLNPQLNRDSWVFAAIVTTFGRQLQLYDCWLTTDPNGGFRYHIIHEGCTQEVSYYVEFDYARGVHKFVGKFLLRPPETANKYYLQCEITTKCPAVTGCLLICNEPRDKYIVTSVEIMKSGGNSTEATTGNSETRVDLVIILIVVAASFFLIFLIVLIVLLWILYQRRRRRRRGQYATPVLVNSSAYNDNIYQNGHSNVNDGMNSYQQHVDVYATVNRETKKSKESEM